MAVIDTFLKLIATHKAERLVLVPDEVPTLYTADEATPLAMPAIPAALAKRLTMEIVGPDRSEELAGEAPVVGRYLSDDGEEFSYQVISHGADCRIEMHSIRTGDDQDGGAQTQEPQGHAPAPRTRESRRPAAGPIPAVDDHERPSVGRAGTPSLQPDPVLCATMEQALLAEASDLFLSSGKRAQVRLNGVINSLGTTVTSDAQILGLIPNEACERELEGRGSIDFGATWNLSGERHRFRINLFRHSRGLAAALRPVRSRIPSLDELHLPGDLLDLCSCPSGLVLVTGASGSGKSTTLAALVDHINRTRARHIITIEDPIEFEHREKKSLIHQREVGTDVESFSFGLRAALRENPDVILLGEMRDLPTISAALTAAETGHLVLSTLHTGNATAAVNRIIDVYPGHQQPHVRVQLASSLRAVVAQCLIPSSDRSGRLPALEKLIVTPAVANGIREGHEHHMQNAMQTGAEEGMVTLERSLASLGRRGMISRDTAFRYANDRQALQKLWD